MGGTLMLLILRCTPGQQPLLISPSPFISLIRFAVRRLKPMPLPAGPVPDIKKTKKNVLSAIRSGDLKDEINVLWGPVIESIKSLSGLN